MSLSRFFLLACLALAVAGFLVLGFTPYDRAGYALFCLSFFFYAFWSHEERSGE